MSRTVARRGIAVKSLVIGLGLMVVGAAMGGLVTRGKNKPDAVAAGAEQAPSTHAQASPAADSAGNPAGHAEVVDLGEFLVNVRSANMLRYLRIQVAVEVTPPAEATPKKKGGHGHGGGEPAAFELPPQDLLRARDAVVTELNVSEFAALRTLEGQEELKKRIGKSLGETLKGYAVGAVLFPAFAMQ